MMTATPSSNKCCRYTTTTTIPRRLLPALPTSHPSFRDSKACFARRQTTRLQHLQQQPPQVSAFPSHQFLGHSFSFKMSVANGVSMTCVYSVPTTHVDPSTVICTNACPPAEAKGPPHDLTDPVRVKTKEELAKDALRKRKRRKGACLACKTGQGISGRAPFYQFPHTAPPYRVGRTRAQLLIITALPAPSYGSTLSRGSHPRATFDHHCSTCYAGFYSLCAIGSAHVRKRARQAEEAGPDLRHRPRTPAVPRNCAGRA